jgi:hypothetical protein
VSGRSPHGASTEGAAQLVVHERRQGFAFDLLRNYQERLTCPSDLFENGSSMVKRVKMPKEVLKFFQATGSEGGKARAERHSKEELREWGKKGGRPRKNGKKLKGTK